MTGKTSAIVRGETKDKTGVLHPHTHSTCRHHQHRRQCRHSAHKPHLSGAFVNNEPNDDILSMMLLPPLPAPPAAAEGAAASDAAAGAAGAGENIDVNGELNLEIADLRGGGGGGGGGA